MRIRPSLVAMLVLAALSPGCGGNTGMTLVDPGKYQFHNCDQLERDIKPLREHARELKELYDKAAREPAGIFVARVSYEADYLTTVGNIELIETAAREKNCKPPINAGISTAARAR